MGLSENKEIIGFLLVPFKPTQKLVPSRKDAPMPHIALLLLRAFIQVRMLPPSPGRLKRRLRTSRTVARREDAQVQWSKRKMRLATTWGCLKMSGPSKWLVSLWGSSLGHAILAGLPACFEVPFA